VRRDLPETFHALSNSKQQPISLRPLVPVAALGVLLLGSATIGIYSASYMTTYAIATLHMRANVAFAATIVVGLCGVLFDLWSGALSDRFGRKGIMLAPGLLLLFTILPAFYVISHFRTTATLLGATAVLSILQALPTAPIVTWLTESLPASIRSSGVAVVYAVSIAIFGGTTQYTIAWLIKVTGNPLAPAWYWTVAMVVGLAAMIATRESAPRKLFGTSSVQLDSADASTMD